MRSRRAAGLVALGSGLALSLAGEPARAFCRITTTQTATDGMDITACYDTTHPPVWWAGACIGLSVQKEASKYASYSLVRDLLFGTVLPNWSNASCQGGGHPSIAFFDLGAVSCAEHQANVYAPNANELIFHDDAWPYDAMAGCTPGECCDRTIALTTVTFHPETGELWDADIEVNTKCHPVSTTLPVPADRYDLQSILQHETGHFLGLAHPPVPSAVMYYLYSQGSDGKRTLMQDDVDGVCTIYPPAGTRSVGAEIADGGSVPEGTCDPAPRNGFATACISDAGDQPPIMPPSTLSCSASPARAGSPFAWAWLVALPLARRRRCRRVLSCRP